MKIVSIPEILKLVETMEDDIQNFSCKPFILIYIFPKITERKNNNESTNRIKVWI